MEILPAEEGIDHGLVTGNMGKQTQLDLTVIGIDQNASFRGNEHPADLRSELLPNRDVLEIRFRGGKATCGRHRHLEVGMNPAIRRDNFQKPFRIGGFQFSQHAVFQHFSDDRVKALELFQHVGIGTPAGFCLFSVWKTEFVKEYLSELFG